MCYNVLTVVTIIHETNYFYNALYIKALSKVLPKVPLLVNKSGVERSHKLYLKRHILCPKLTSCQLPIDSGFRRL